MPNIIHWQTTPEQAHDHIAQALVLLDEHELTADERANLLPVIVGLLALKPVGIVPDAPPIALPHLAGGRH
jgi:hypothetical protein